MRQASPRNGGDIRLASMLWRASPVSRNGLGLFGHRATGSIPGGGPHLQNLAAELDHLTNHLVGRFQHHELLSIGQADHRIRRRLHMFDQVRVQDQRNVIDASQMNHECTRQPATRLSDRRWLICERDRMPDAESVYFSISAGAQFLANSLSSASSSVEGAAENKSACTFLARLCRFAPRAGFRLAARLQEFSRAFDGESLFVQQPLDLQHQSPRPCGGTADGRCPISSGPATETPFPRNAARTA